MLISNTLEAKNEKPGCSLDPKIRARLCGKHQQMQNQNKEERFVCTIGKRQNLELSPRHTDIDPYLVDQWRPHRYKEKEEILKSQHGKSLWSSTLAAIGIISASFRSSDAKVLSPEILI